MTDLTREVAEALCKSAHPDVAEAFRMDGHPPYCTGCTSQAGALIPLLETLRIKGLVEASSFGTPEAKALRASVSDEQAARVVARARELEAEQRGYDRGRAEACVVGREAHDEWIEELCALIPEGDESRYSNPEGAVESIILDCFRAYAADRQEAEKIQAELRAALGEATGRDGGDDR